MDAIDVVAAHHVQDHAERARAGVRAGGIAPGHRAVAFGDLRRGAGDVVAGDLLGVVGKRAEGIEPRMHLDAAGVGLADAEGQRIIARRAAHGAGQPRAPRLDGRLLERVALRPHLEDHGVHFQRGHLVEDAAQFRLLGCRR